MSCMKMKEHLNLFSIAFDHRLQLPAFLSAHFCISFFQFFSPPSFMLTKKKTESCSRYVALAKYCVTCQLNTFQEEPQKLKIFLRTMNVSEDYCDRITTCDRLIIWNWFCAHTNAWLFFALLSLFLLLFETANAFAACLIFFLSPPPPPFSLCLFYLPSFGL